MKSVLALFVLFGANSIALENSDFDVLPDYTADTCYGRNVEGLELTDWCREVAALAKKSKKSDGKNTAALLAQLSVLHVKHGAEVDEDTLIERKLGLLELALWREQIDTVKAISKRLVYKGNYDSKRSILQSLRLVALKASVGVETDSELIESAAFELASKFLHEKVWAYSDGGHIIAAGNFAHHFLSAGKRELADDLLNKCTEQVLAWGFLAPFQICNYQIFRSEEISGADKKKVAEKLVNIACSEAYKRHCESVTRGMEELGYL